MPRRTPFEQAVLMLDHEAPDWRTCVDPQRLVMHSPTACVLGQTYGNYLRGYDALGLESKPDLVDCFVLATYRPLWVGEIERPRPRKLSLWQRVKRRFA
jgi:hypothetical protein